MGSSGVTSDDLMVRSAEPDDHSAIAKIYCEYLRRLGGEDPIPEECAVADALTQDAGTPRLPMECLVACTSDKKSVVLGFAIITPMFGLPGRGDALSLRHLVVAQDHRRRGIGRLLMARAAARAVELKCRRLEWTVARLDLDTRAFFEMVVPDSFRLNELTYIADFADLLVLAKP